MKKIKYRLGLDLGSNSIGWAMLELNEDNEPIKIFRTGVRIFSDGRNPKNKEPLTIARRIARGQRRRRDRYLRRHYSLLRFLRKKDLMPSSPDKAEELKKLDPYHLRARALDEQLPSHELGRLLINLSRRRGFKSNRKALGNSDEKGKNNIRITELDKAIADSGSRTLGEYLFSLRQKGEMVRFRAESKFYPSRKQYEDEFNLIKINQGNGFLSEDDWNIVFRKIFFQRPLAPQEPGFCRFKASEGKKRARLALFSTQEFLMLQDLNNLKIITPDGHKKRLTQDEHNKLKIKLRTLNDLALSDVKLKILKYSDDYGLNFESSFKDKIVGNKVSKLLSGKKYFGKKWFDFSIQEKDQIVEMLIDSDDEVVEKNIRSKFDYLSEEQIKNLILLELSNFPAGYGAFCEELYQELIEQMDSEERPLYHQALENLGISHSDFRPSELRDSLPYYGELLHDSVVKREMKSLTANEEEKKFGIIANPTVHVGLNQLRKVVNRLMKFYGRPYEINIELARDFGLSKEGYDKLDKLQRDNKKRNDRIRQTLSEFSRKYHLEINRENIEKYKLWEELSKNELERCCPYSGEVISLSKLFSAEVEIDHILPISKTFDDSLSNKIICITSQNRIKRGRPPFEAFGSDQDKYIDILQRIKSLPLNKQWRFEKDAMSRFEQDNSFIARQLNDTRYLSRTAKRYLLAICPKINTTRGMLTAKVRDQWNLNSVLSNDNEKNRSDHRQHAVDALIIGVLDEKLLWKASKHTKENLDKFKISQPWGSFFEDVKNSVHSIVVSHKIDHGFQGAIFEESNYGAIKPRNNEEAEYNLVIRKSLDVITAGQVEEIRDQKIKNLLQEYSEKHGGDKNSINAFKSDFNIKSVRVLIKDKSAVLLKKKKTTRSVIPAENILITLWRNPDGSSVITSLSSCEAYQGVSKKPHPFSKKICDLYKGDCVELEEKGVTRLYLVTSISPSDSNKKITLMELFKSVDKKKLNRAFSYLKKGEIRKIHIDEIGNVNSCK